MTGPRDEQTDPAAQRLAAVGLAREAHALCYALVMALAATPREELTCREIDALCQLAFELWSKLGKTLECLDEFDRALSASRQTRT